MTVDEALSWARSTVNERWALVCGQDEATTGDAFERRNAEAMDTLANEVKRLKAENLDYLVKTGSESGDSDDYWAIKACCDDHGYAADAEHTVPEVIERVFADLASVTADRDKLAQQWAEMRAWFTTPMADENDAQRKMRELERER